MARRNHRFLLSLTATCLAAGVQTLAAAEGIAPWSVKVTAADGAPVAQATVLLLGLRGETVHASELTDAAGEAKLQPPARGGYRIRVDKKGFKRKELPLMTSLGAAPTVTIKLEPGT